MKRSQWIMSSPVGPLHLVASDKGLEGIHWSKQEVPVTPSLKGSGKEIRILAQAVKQLEEYFAGKRKTFKVPLELKGTVFQKKVWGELLKIPYGKTRAYKDIACGIRNKKAMRAVGTANGKNPISIIVPCHRVIAADGTLGGYFGGLKAKRKLLDLECSAYSENK